ncbi:MAG: hydrogenase [Deltaproteobacteria bacterium]|nr:hydrogenase [Deltaproteobacteria bacterium]
MTTDLILISIAVILAGGFSAVFTGRSGKGGTRAGVLSCLAGAVFAIIAGCITLYSGAEAEIRMSWPVPFGSFYIGIDPLSAFFLITISIVCAIGAVYGASYMNPYKEKKNINVAWLMFNLLFASMLIVVVSRNGILFLMAWEIMALSSFFLVMFEHEKNEVRDAGWVYLVAAHAGQACLMCLFILLAGDNPDFDFDSFSIASPSPGANALFLLALTGFGVKAGLMPVHVWLPEAHPAAPSHVSAVMSGVMIKTGIYGIIRIISLIGAPEQWWAYTLIGIGAVTGITGILFALAQRDIKRLLAYSSVENIGIITIGLGLWVLGTSINNTVIAALGLTGGLLHVLNHSIFKSLLFFGAGSVAHGTGTRNIDLLGGLIKSMPKTAITFGIGSAAICGFPPLNGFVSEFLIYYGSFSTLTSKISGGPVTGGLVAIFAMCLIGGLAAVCFTKVFGIVFLGEPRSENAVNVHEAHGTMQAAMIIASALCIILGISGPLAVIFVKPVAAQLLGENNVPELSSLAFGLLYRITLAGAATVIIAGLLWWLRSILLSGRVNSKGPTWDCGYLKPTGRMQYTASSFAWPVISMFRWIVRPGLNVDVSKGLFPERGLLSSRTDDVFNKGLFTPIFRFTSLLAQRVHKLQEGRNQLYVLYIAVTILILLLVKVR